MQQQNLLGSVTGGIFAMICNVSVFMQGEYINAFLLGLIGATGGWIATKILDKIFNKDNDETEQ